MRLTRFACPTAAVVLALVLAAAVSAQTGGESSPEQRRALEKEVGELNARAVGLARQNKLQEAAMELERAVAKSRKLDPKTNHPALASSLNNLGVVLHAQGDLARAEEHYRAALALRQQLYPKGHPELARTLNNLGRVLRARDDLAGAEKYYCEALALYRRLYPKGHPDLADCLDSLGNVLKERGDLTGAEAPLRDALTMRQRLLPQGHPELARSLNNLGVVLHAQGDLAGAEEHYRAALALRQRLYPKGHPDLAGSLFNLGDVLKARGELAGAEKLHRAALALRQRLYPEGHPDLAHSLNRLGSVLRLQGDLVEAESLLGEALAMSRRLWPKGHRGLAACLNSLGNLLAARGDLDGAESLLREALAMSQRLWPKNDRDLAASHYSLGLVLFKRGELVGAEMHYREALALYQRLFPQGHLELAACLNDLGVLLYARGDPAGAEPRCREALAMYQRLLFQEAGLAAESVALNLAGSLPLTRDIFLTLTRSRPNDAAVYDLVWQGRSTLTRVLEQRHRDLLASKDPDVRSLSEKLLSARLQLSYLLLTPVRNDEKHAQQVRALTDTKEGLEKELARKLRLELPPADPVLAPPRRLSELLPDGVAFLDFYRYTFFAYNPKVPGIKGERRIPHYVAFVLAKDKPAVRVELGAAAPLEKAWAAWRAAITRGAPHESERKAAAALAKLVWEPIRKRLSPGVKIIYLTPDGALTQVPWAALPGPKPNTVLLEECAFATVPHGPSLLDRLDRPKASQAKGGTLVAVGGVDYHKSPDKETIWKPLPATQAELKSVTDLARQDAGLDVCTLSVGDASTARVLAELPRARYAHLATHGFFADADVRPALQVDSGLFVRLTPDRRGGARSPLVLSGLVFAGANRRGKEADPDRGILTAEGLVGLRLDKLELAVLSACDTGLGEVAGGEGVFGLQRAFHIAGARNVVASLWHVNDRATAALMAQFYHNLWEKKLAPAEALRQAQLAIYLNPDRIPKLAGDRSTPTFKTTVRLPPGAATPGRPAPGAQRAPTRLWAAFILSGDGR